MIEVSSEQSRSKFYMNTRAAAATAAALSRYYYCCCFSFCYLDTVWSFTTEYLDLIDYNYTVRCCTTYEYVFVYTCHVFVLLMLCVAIMLLLLLFAIVCRVTQFVAVLYCI